MRVKFAGYYTMAEVCELTSLSRKTIYRLVDAGQFPAPDPLTRTPRGRIGFQVPAVNRWLADRARRKEKDPEVEPQEPPSQEPPSQEPPRQ